MIALLFAKAGKADARHYFREAAKAAAAIRTRLGGKVSSLEICLCVIPPLHTPWSFAKAHRFANRDSEYYTALGSLTG